MPTHHRPRPALAQRGRARILPAALLSILALAVAGCGATTPSAGAPHPSPTTTADSGPPGQGLGVRPCPALPASAGQTASGAVILTENSPIVSTPTLPPTREAKAHVGGLIQIRLPTSVHWGLQRATGVSPLDPQGGEDDTLGVCFWNFRAAAAGDATISFTGTAICNTAGPCPLWAREETFIVHIAA